MRLFSLPSFYELLAKSVAAAEKDEEMEEVLKQLPCIERALIWFISKANGLKEDEPELGEGSTPGLDTRTSVAERKVHLLTNADRWRISLLIWAVIGVGLVAGLVAAGLAQALTKTAAQQAHSNSSAHFWVLVSLYSFIWTTAECGLIYLAALWGTARLARVCRLQLWPLDRERALLAGALVRSALELGQPQGRQLGVDPQKKASTSTVLLSTVWYFFSRTLVKFVLSFLVTKLGPRVTVKTAAAQLVAVEILVNVFFNVTAVRVCMLETSVCCMGPSAATEACMKLLQQRQNRAVEREGHPSPLTDEVKLNSMRAVGAAAASSFELHPNCRHLLGLLVKLWATEDFVSRMTKLQSTLPERSLKSPGPCHEKCDRVLEKAGELLLRVVQKLRGLCSSCAGSDAAPPTRHALQDSQPRIRT